MESVEKDCSVLGNMFQTIINDMRTGAPVWEDFAYKATKLHQCLKSTLAAVSSFLEAFQKVADMAMNSRGATKEIGSALTRLCMRHKNIETCLKSLTNSVLDSVIAPLQERLEDWKKTVAQLDKDHAKEYKRARQEIKKAASDTMKLQRKISKGKNEMQKKLESAMHEVNDKYLLLEETEKNSLRVALIEERSRFCVFISCIKPFVDHEVHLMSEVTHLQEIMHSLCLQASEPQSLPDSSEQFIADLKGVDLATLALQGKQHPSPPSSPSSLGSRKSSVCSINSINSCSSTSSKSHSPGHTLQKHNTVQLPLGVERLTSVSSQDSGFTSQDTLFVRSTTPLSLNIYQDSSRSSTSMDATDGDSTPCSPDLDTTLTPSSFSTNSLPFSSSNSSKIDRSRPHTISAGSEKTYARLAIKPELFEPLPEKGELPEETEGVDKGGRGSLSGGKGRSNSMSADSHYARPAAVINKMQPVLPPHCPRPKMKAVPPPALPSGPQPDYANTAELHQLVMERKAKEQQHAIQENQTISASQTMQPSLKASDNDCTRDALELEEAIRSLDSVTAALGAEIAEEERAVVEQRREREKEREDFDMALAQRSPKMQQNSIELAEAIRELQESTAALHSYDTDSHKSLQCSSGYATMDNTPSGSDDVIPPAVPEQGPILHEPEKYFTLPRGAEMNSTLRSALLNSRPPSTSVAGSTLTRRSSMNTPKPPPPVRRTASISYSAGRPRASPPRQQSESVAGSASNSESFYAELQTVQQGSQQIKSQHQPPVYPKPASLQRQHSVGYPYPQQLGDGTVASGDAMSDSSESSSHYAIPHISSAGSAHLLQSLNAQFASLNQQYQDPQYQTSNVGGTYVGLGGDVGPDAASLMPPPGGSNSQQSHYAYGGVGVQPAYQGHPHNFHPPSVPGAGDAGDLPPPPTPGEDFPLPPTAEELAEMETLYAKPPPVNPKPKMTGDLMMELKRRMSADDYSNA